MSEANEAGDSSTAVNVSRGRPDSRSRYEHDRVLDLSTSYPEPYKVGQEVYLKGARRVDPKPYTIHKILGDGQYELSRNGGCDHKPYRYENLQTEYPERYKIGDEVYLKGTRGVDPKPYKIHEVHGNGQYELSRDGEVKIDPEIHLTETLQTDP